MRLPSRGPRCGSVALLAVAAQLAACANPPTPRVAEAAAAERGAYLVEIGGCQDCHSLKVFTAAGPVPDTTRLLSGHPAQAGLPTIPRGLIAPDGWGALTNNDLTAWAGRWGVSFAANLTPDPVARSVDPGAVHPNHAHGETPGSRPADSAADAVVQLCQDE
ncbi:MAG: hypothetical protein ACREL9_02790 [Gemmatimonadales bacterium]